MKNKVNKVCNRRNLHIAFVSGLLLSSLYYPSFMNANNVNERKMSIEQSVRKYDGIVLDADTGEPLIGASVALKGTAQGVITDIDGRFSITASQGQMLVISYLGYHQREIKLTSASILKVELSADSKSLEEVVVTAFGVGQKKESVVGAISQIRGKELNIPSANLSNSFAGRISGVTAFQRGGEPGNDGSSFYIRGISTFTATNPLIIIDGVEASAADLNALDSEVIESFSVLKDATATAMYGTRGANGVMIVKTKNGENVEKAIINARIEGYLSMPTKTPKFTDAQTFMHMFNEAATNYGTGSQLYTQEFMDGVKKGDNPLAYPNVDWYDEIFKDATMNERVNFNVRGGSKRVNYFINANFNHETGLLKGRSKDFYSYDNNIDVKRYTFQTNIQAHLTSTAQISMNLGVELRDTHGPSVGSGDLYSKVMDSNPVDFPVLYPMDSSVDRKGNVNDYVKWGAYDYGMVSRSANPVAHLTKGYHDGFASTVRANVKYVQKLDFITKGLKFTALASFKNWASNNVSRDRNYNMYSLKSMNNGECIISPLQPESTHVLSTNRTTNGDRSYYFQANLNYDRTFKEVHHVSAMALFNLDQFETAGATNDLITTLPKRRMGLAARLSYNYADRYMVEFNMGYNGAEHFSEGHRWGFFPSLALAWNLSQEDWFQPLTDVIHNLKLRGSYGLVGNADSSTRFMYLPIIKLQGKGFSTGDGDNGITFNGPLFSRFRNDEISWEIGYKTNVGIDLGLFNSFNISLEYFSELRKDIFRKNQTIPYYIGVSNAEVFGNYAEVKNWGIEASIDYGKQITKDFSVQFKGTFSFARNKVMKDAASWNPDYPNKSSIGLPLNYLSGYRYAGHLFKDNAEIESSPKQMISGNVQPGDIKYVDIPNRYGVADGLINPFDQVPMGHPTVPEIIYGFGPSFKYKKWDFSFFFQGVANTSLMMSGFHPFGKEGRRNVLQFIADDYWSDSNQNIYAKYPRLTEIEQPNNTVSSDYWLRNASFLKLKNAEVGFSWKFLRAYVSGSNLLTFSPFKHWDPEMGGGSGLKYPTQRVINFGIQMNFK